MSVASAELLRAAAFGDLNRLRSLLAQGVDINSTNKANQTALILATAFKRIEIVQYLILAGADVKVQDELGLTAADWARSDTRITKLLNAQSPSAVEQESQESQESLPAQTNHQVGTKLTGLAGAILRAQTSANSATAATLARETPVIAEPVSVLKEETVAETLERTSPALAEKAQAPVDPPRAPERMLEPRSLSELLQAVSSVDIPTPHIPPKSPAGRSLLRVGMVVLLVVGIFSAYHFVTFMFSTRTSSDVKPEPASIPANAATTATKSAPVVAGELAGTELFLPDAEYPPDATVAAGNVTVGIQVSPKGIVVKAEALSGDESLRRAAEKAALSSAFAPEKLKDKESLIDGTITYNFLKPNDAKPSSMEFGFLTDAVKPDNVSAAAGGPLAGAERKLAIPKIPKSMRVEQESATLVVRVNRAGRVVSYRPLDVEARLRSYLIRAARASTFDPAKLSGEGNVVGIITYKFH